MRRAVAAAAIAVAAARPVTWTDLPGAIHARLQRDGVDGASFRGLIERLDRTHAQRVREGDLDHLVFYVLQSHHFTTLPSIEPAVSAQRFRDSGRVPDAARTRIAAFLRVVDNTDSDARFGYLSSFAKDVWPAPRDREVGLTHEYERAMTFLYQKEFVAQRGPDPAGAVEALYHSRGFSTDTAVEAGYVVYLGLAVLKAIEPEHRVRRVLVVGPGLDLAPRTGFIDSAPPESYQPWAVIDALVALGLSRVDELDVLGADINPRVVDHLRHEHEHPPLLHLASGLDAGPSLTLESGYREYFARLGNAIAVSAQTPPDAKGRLMKTVQVQPAVARALAAERLDVVTERLTGAPFDLVIATNILPYFDDTELALALSNIAGMLAPGGILMHNDLRPGLPGIAEAAGLSLQQSRQVPIARVAGATPLVDTIFLHRRR